MKIRIYIESEGAFEFPRVVNAGLFLMERFRSNPSAPIMGKMTVSRLREYGKKFNVSVKCVDHTTHWRDL